MRTSNVHHRFWTPPIVTCEAAQALRTLGYEVLTKEGPLAQHGGGPNTLFFGVASWATGCDQKLYESGQVKKPIPRPVAKTPRLSDKPQKLGPRDRRKCKIYAGAYASKTPKIEEPVFAAKFEGDLTGKRIQVRLQTKARESG